MEVTARCCGGAATLSQTQAAAPRKAALEVTRPLNHPPTYLYLSLPISTCLYLSLPICDCALVMLQAGLRYTGKCEFWNARQGWGRIGVDGGAPLPGYYLITT